MARLALLVLLLANVGFFAWSHDWLRDFGLGPERQSEPQRIAQQIRPDALVIVGHESQGRGDAGDRAEPQSQQSRSQAGSSTATARAPAGEPAATTTAEEDCAPQSADRSASASESAAARKPSGPCARSGTSTPASSAQ